MIRFLTVKGKTAAEIHRELVHMPGKNCTYILNVRRWRRNFENNHGVSLKDEWCNGHLVDSLVVDNICCAHEILKADDCFTLDKIVERMLLVECGWSTICILTTATHFTSYAGTTLHYPAVKLYSVAWQYYYIYKKRELSRQCIVWWSILCL